MAHSNPADYIPGFIHVLCAINEIELEVEWKMTLLSFKLVDIRPRRRHVVAPIRSTRPLNLSFTDIAFESRMVPVLGLVWMCGGSRITCACQAHFHRHKDFAHTQTRGTITIPTGW